MHVAHDRFELVDVCQKALAAALGDAIDRLRAPRGPLLFDRDDAEIGKRVNVPVQVTVGKIASRGKLRKAKAVGMGDQTRADRKPPTLVKDPFEPRIRKWRFSRLVHGARSFQISVPTASCPSPKPSGITHHASATCCRGETRKSAASTANPSVTSTVARGIASREANRPSEYSANHVPGSKAYAPRSISATVSSPPRTTLGAIDRAAVRKPLAAAGPRCRKTQIATAP